MITECPMDAEKVKIEKKPITVKFSHLYLKMPRFDLLPLTIIVNIAKVKTKDLPKEFLDYDTAYFEGNVLKHYPIDFEDGILITFLSLGAGSKLWTTLRRWTPKKEEYYMENIGNVAEIEMIKNE